MAHRLPPDVSAALIAAETDRDAATRSYLHADAARQQAEAARDHCELLLRVTVDVAACEGLDDAARTVSHLARTGLGATLAGVLVHDPDPHRLGHRPAVEAPDLDLTAAQDLVVALGPAPEGAADAGAVFAMDPEAVARAYPAAAGALGATGVRSLARVPLVRDGRVDGALVLAWSRSRPLTAQDREVIAALARSGVQALDRCQASAVEREAARTLQRALVPALPRPSHLGDLELAARYLPAAQSQQVGGDWYDVLVGPRGSTTLVVGDVTGHDIQAAAAMGRVSTALRTLVAVLDEAPAALLGRLDDVLGALEPGTSATVLLARLEGQQDATPSGRLLRWSSAGHHPPLVVRPDGDVHVLAAAPELLLGVQPSPRTDHLTVLPAGATLLLHTDGLVERRDHDLARGQQRLIEALTSLGHRPLDDLLDALLARMLDDGAPEDDVTVMAVQVPDGAAGGSRE